MSIVDDIDLILPDPNCFDNYYVFAHSIQHNDSISCGSSEPTESASRSQGSDEHSLVHKMLLHPDSVPKYSASGEWARRVNGKHSHRFVVVAELGHDAIHKGRFADTG